MLLRYPSFRNIIIKGPGLRNDLDVRRVWRCPTCGQTKRLTQNITSARCGCTRDGVPMKLVEEPRSPRIALRAEVQAVIDRLQAGEVIPRLVSAIAPNRSDASDLGENSGDRRPPRKPFRQESARPETPQEPPRDESVPRDSPSGELPSDPVAATTNDPPTMAPPPVVPAVAESDDFAAGLTDDKPSSSTWRSRN